VRRLLLVTYYYPPLGGPGVFRPLRLSKYLPRLGWAVTVVAASARTRALKDPSLLAEVDPRVRVERTASIEPRLALMTLTRLGLRRLVLRIAPWLMVPDDQLGWVPFAWLAARRLLRRVEHHAMVTTAAPYSAHLVGRALHRATRIPWVADFRDEWTTNPYLRDRYPTAWHRRLNRSLERSVLEEADRVVCVSEPWLETLRGLVPDQPRQKFSVLPNGFDAEHFPDEPPPVPRDRFRVVYTGMFYGHRTPDAFLAGLERLLASRRIPAGDVEVVFMGHPAAATRGPRPLRGATMRVLPHRPYFEALELLREAAVLLLVVPPEGGAGNHTGKLFPYLAAGRPILTLAPEPNVAAQLVRESRSGVVGAPDDPGAIATALEGLYDAWKRGAGGPAPDRALIARYTAARQAEDWARLLDELAAQRATASRISTSLRETTGSE
jgi:glycosyltransferase involved in cell wall biosynthesis